MLLLTLRGAANSFPFVAALAALGLVLLVRGRAWVGRLARLARRRRARDTVVFLVSIGQVLLPVLGAILLLLGIVATGMLLYDTLFHDRYQP